jgi:hypothetical protein
MAVELPINQQTTPTLSKPHHNKRNFFIGLGAILVVAAVAFLFFYKPANNKIVAPLKEVVETQNCDADQSEVSYQKGTSPYPKLDWSNNKFGVHSYSDPSSLRKASEMINSNGGDWGWVTIPYNISNVNPDHEAYWNSVMQVLCEEHLTPIFQLFNEGKPPTEKQTRDMAEFLSNLKWPTKLKFITAYSEVNASEYWGGKLDPEGYARALNLTIDELKKRDKDFFVMPAAFNSSARDNPGFTTDLGVFTSYMNLPTYLERMDQSVPGIFKKIDGWAAHTYPHPGYRGKPSDESVPGETEFEKGRNTLRSYQYDLRVLKDLFDLELPVFITETGWPHREGTTVHSEWLPASTVAQYYEDLFTDLYLPDARVIAVTPFVMQQKGVDNFAFLDSKDRPYPQFDILKNLPKTPGRPELE